MRNAGVNVGKVSLRSRTPRVRTRGPIIANPALTEAEFVPWLPFFFLPFRALFTVPRRSDGRLEFTWLYYAPELKCLSGCWCAPHQEWDRAALKFPPRAAQAFCMEAACLGDRTISCIDSGGRVAPLARRRGTGSPASSGAARWPYERAPGWPWDAEHCDAASRLDSFALAAEDPLAKLHYRA